MTREEYMRLMAMRAEQQMSEYDDMRRMQALRQQYELEMAKRAQDEQSRQAQEQQAMNLFLEGQRKAMEAAKPKKSSIALEAEKGNVIDAEFVEVKPEKSPSKLIPKG